MLGVKANKPTASVKAKPNIANLNKRACSAGLRLSAKHYLKRVIIN
jgi:hypothetical protein